MSTEDKKFLTSKFIPRSSNYLDVIQQRQGKRDFDENFDNEFQEYKLVVKTVIEVIEAIKQDIIPLKEFERLDLMPDAEVIRNINSIWDGKCFYFEIRNEKRTKILMKIFCYTNPNVDPKENLRVRKIMVDHIREQKMNEIKLMVLHDPSEFQINIFDMTEDKIKAKSQYIFDTTVTVEDFENLVNQYMNEGVLIPIPRLRNMVPVGKIDDKENWGIETRENYYLKYAWEGANYNTVIQDAKFSFYTMAGLIPKIVPSDMYSTTKKSYVFHKPVYHELMLDLVHFFRKNAIIFDLNLQKINHWMAEEMELEMVQSNTETETDDDDDEEDEVETGRTS